MTLEEKAEEYAYQYASKGSSKGQYEWNQHYHGFNSGFVAGYTIRDGESQWVSVLDEKPPFVEFVLCYSVKGSISYRCFSKTHEEFTKEQFISIIGITHWSLPQPPKKD